MWKEKAKSGCCLLLAQSGHVEDTKLSENQQQNEACDWVTLSWIGLQTPAADNGIICNWPANNSREIIVDDRADQGVFDA